MSALGSSFFLLGSICPYEVQQTISRTGLLETWYQQSGEPVKRSISDWQTKNCKCTFFFPANMCAFLLKGKLILMCLFFYWVFIWQEILLLFWIFNTLRSSAVTYTTFLGFWTDSCHGICSSPPYVVYTGNTAGHICTQRRNSFCIQQSSFPTETILILGIAVEFWQTAEKTVSLLQLENYLPVHNLLTLAQYTISASAKELPHMHRSCTTLAQPV